MTDLNVHAAGWVSLTFTAPNGETADAWAKTAVRPDGTRTVTALVLRGERISSTITSRFPVGWLESRLESITGVIASFEDFPDPLGPLAEGPGEAFVEYTTVSTSSREPLSRPDGLDPERFYARVAEAYREVLASGAPIAPTLAAESGVPVRTVHRWITESRRRGYLPPGRRGNPSSRSVRTVGGRDD